MTDIFLFFLKRKPQPPVADGRVRSGCGSSGLRNRWAIHQRKLILIPLPHGCLSSPGLRLKAATAHQPPQQGPPPCLWTPALVLSPRFPLLPAPVPVSEHLSFPLATCPCRSPCDVLLHGPPARLWGPITCQPQCPGCTEGTLESSQGRGFPRKSAVRLAGDFRLQVHQA